MNILKNKLFWLIGMVLFLPTTVLSAGNLGTAGDLLEDTGIQAGTTGQSDLPTVIGGVISTALSMIGLIFMILMVYAGFIWMTARGDEERVKKARSIIIQSVIGVVIVIAAYAITYLVTSIFEG